MIRNQYEQDDRMQRGQAGNYGYAIGPYGQPTELQDERYFATGNPARYESERAFGQWQAPQGYMAPVGAFGLPPTAGLLPHALQAQASPYGLGLAADPWAAAYFQGVAPRAYFTPGLSPVHPLFGQGQMFRPPGLVPLINEPINRFAGMATGNIGSPDMLLQQQLLQQQQMQQQLRPSATPASFRGIGPKGYVRSDERLKDDVCERLAGHPDIDASDVTVDVRQGVVSLTGTVNHRLVKHEIEDLIDNVIGVKDIENHILVRPRVENRSMAQAGEGQGPAQVAKPRH